MKVFLYIFICVSLVASPNSSMAQAKGKKSGEGLKLTAKGKRKAFPTCLAEGQKAETMRKIRDIQKILACQGKSPKECQRQSGLGKLGLAAGAVVGATAAARVRNPEFRVCPFTPRVQAPMLKIGLAQAYASNCTPEAEYHRALLTDTIDRTRADLFDISMQLGRAEQALYLERERILQGDVPEAMQDPSVQQIQADLDRISSENEALHRTMLDSEMRIRSQTGGMSFDDLQARLGELRLQREAMMRASSQPGEKPRLTANEQFQLIQGEILDLEAKAKAVEGDHRLVSDLRHQVDWNESMLRNYQARMRDVSMDLSIARLSQIGDELNTLGRARANVDYWNEDLSWDRSRHSRYDFMGRPSTGTEFIESVEKIRDAIGETSPQQGMLLSNLIQETHPTYRLSYGWGGWGAESIWRKLGIGGALFAFVTSASAKDFASTSMSDAIFSDPGGCGEYDPYFSFSVFEGSCRRSTRLDPKSARFFELSEEKMEQLIRNPGSFHPERNEFCELIENAHSSLVKTVAETKCSADVIEVNFSDGLSLFLPTSDRRGFQSLAIRGPNGVQEYDFADPKNPKVNSRSGSGLRGIGASDGRIQLQTRTELQGGRPAPVFTRALQPGSGDYVQALGQYASRIVAAMEARGCCVSDEVRPTPGECRALGVRAQLPVKGESVEDESAPAKPE